MCNLASHVLMRSISLRSLAWMILAVGLAGCANTVNPDRNFAPPAAEEPVPALTGLADIVKALRAGGYIIYMRHSLTNRDELIREEKSGRASRFSLDDCVTQRNLSPEGIALAHEAGSQFRRLGLPVAQHVSSRYCRVVQTARMFADEIILSDPLSYDGPVVKSPNALKASARCSRRYRRPVRTPCCSPIRAFSTRQPG